MNTPYQSLSTSTASRFAFAIGFLMLLLSLLILFCYSLKKRSVRRRIRKIRSRKAVNHHSHKSTGTFVLAISCFAVSFLAICVFFLLTS